MHRLSGFRSALVLFGLSLLGVCRPGLAHATSFNFSQQVYTAIETLEDDDDPRKFDRAFALMSLAREQAINPDARQMVETALGEVADWRQAATPFPTDARIQTVITYLKNSLAHNRVQLSRHNPEEIKFMERLVKTSLFPDGHDRVDLKVDGIELPQALNLMMTYIIDPRASKYDRDVAALVLGRMPDGSESSTRVRFLVRVADFDLSSTQPVQEQAQHLENELKGMFPNHLPIKPHVWPHRNQLGMVFEVLGFKYAPLVEGFLKEGLGAAAGNRYFHVAANKAEAVSNLMKILGQRSSVLQPIANTIAAGLDQVTTLMNSRLAGRTWVDPTPATVKWILQGQRATRVQEIETVVAPAVARLRELGVTDVEMAKITGGHAITAFSAVPAVKLAEAQDLIEQVAPQYKQIRVLRIGYDKLLAKVGDSVTALERTAEFRHMAPSVQSSERLLVAQRAANFKVKLPTLQGVMQGVALVTAGYYAYQGVLQYTRSSDPAEKLMIMRHYGVKVICALLYAVPVVQEAAFIVDFGSWIGNSLLAATGGNWRFSNVEDLLNGLITVVEGWGYRAGGSSRFQVMAGEIEQRLDLAPLVQMTQSQDPDRRFTDVGLNRFRSVLKKFHAGQADATALAKAREEYRVHVKALATKVLLFLYFLDDEFGPRYNREVGDLQYSLFKQMTESDHGRGYLNHSLQVFRAASDAIGGMVVAQSAAGAPAPAH